MAVNVMSFALLFAASIAVYCAISYALWMRQRKLDRRLKKIEKNEQE